MPNRSFSDSRQIHQKFVSQHSGVVELGFLLHLYIGRKGRHFCIVLSCYFLRASLYTDWHSGVGGHCIGSVVALCSGYSFCFLVGMAPKVCFLCFLCFSPLEYSTNGPRKIAGNRASLPFMILFQSHMYHQSFAAKLQSIDRNNTNGSMIRDVSLRLVILLQYLSPHIKCCNWL